MNVLPVYSIFECNHAHWSLPVLLALSSPAEICIDRLDTRRLQQGGVSSTHILNLHRMFVVRIYLRCALQVIGMGVGTIPVVHVWRVRLRHTVRRPLLAGSDTRIVPLESIREQ